MFVAREHFFETSGGTAGQLFKQSVKNVEIEISSYCNRTCKYCPNSIVDRLSTKKFMDPALYSRIVEQLGSIEYTGQIVFHRYNEPLADKEYALEKMKECALAAPHATPTIYTNGDYLDADYIEKLFAAGCKSIKCTIHINGKNTNQSRFSHVSQALRRFGMPNFSVVNTEEYCSATIHYDDRVFEINCVPFEGYFFSSRAGAGVSSAQYSRTSPCPRPFDTMSIEMDGSYLPCCEIRSDVPSHAGSMLGRLTPDADLFDHWASSAYAALRRAFVTFDPKTGPCGQCDRSEFHDTAETRSLFATYAASFQGKSA